MQSKRRGWLFRLIMVIVIGLLVVFFPKFIRHSYYINVAIFVLFFLCGALCVWLVQQLGLLPLCYGAFFGLGAYSTAVLTKNLGWNFWAAFPIGGLVAVLGAALISILTLKLRGIYFALVTFVFGEVFVSIAILWRGLTKGASGISGIPAPNSIAGITFTTLTAQYYLILSLAVITFYVVYRIHSSRFGINIRLIAGSERLAESVGVSIFRYRMIFLVLTAFLVGIVGGFWPAFMTFICPMDVSFFNASLPYIIYSIVGGVGSLAGPVVGSVVIVGITQGLLPAAGMYQSLFYGLLLLIITLFAPKGIMGLVAQIRWDSLPGLLRIRRSGGKA